MLTTILERNSILVYQIGKFAVFFYHLLISSVFFNTAAEDASGIERLADLALAPMQYFFDGKKAIPIYDNEGNLSYQLETRFDYKNHFFMKTASSVAILPFSIVAGGTLKGVSYLSPNTRDRAVKLEGARHAKTIEPNHTYYKAIGMKMEDYRLAEMIAPPRWERHPDAEHRLGPDVEALKEIVRILSHHEIPFWLDCGSCLGTYQYGGAIPHDWDIDVAVLVPDFQNVKNALQELDPKKFLVQDWSGRARPNSYLKVFVHESGGLIDIYHFAIDEEKKEIHTHLSNEHNIFFPESWKIRERRYCTPMPFSYVFPLKKAIYEGIEVPVPGQIENYLQVFYGENLAPAKLYNEISGNYERDPTHSYWQLPNAH